MEKGTGRMEESFDKVRRRWKNPRYIDVRFGVLRRSVHVAMHTLCILAALEVRIVASNLQR